MTGKRPVTPAGVAFLAELKAYYERCGSAPYRELATASDALPKERWPRTLSPTAISEILTGHRLPNSAWLASFILCCQQYGWKVGKFKKDPGPDTLPEWQEKLQAVKAADRLTESPPPEVPDAVSPDMLPVEVPASEDNTVGPGFTLTAEEHDYVAAQGPAGQKLLAELKSGRPEAAYRLAVVLAASPIHHRVGISLLMGPGTTGHEDSLALLEIPPGAEFRQAVGEHACELGATALAEGDTEAAVVFYTCAARCCSHEGSIELLSILLTERGEHQAAAEIRAANLGDATPVRPAMP